MSHRSFVLSLSFFVLASTLLGCEENKPRLGGFCGEGSECPPGQICTDGACVFACGGDSDCPDGYLCKDELCLQQCASTEECTQSGLVSRYCNEGLCERLNPPGVIVVGAPSEANEGDVVVLTASESLLSDPSTSEVTWTQITSLPKGVEVSLIAAGAEKADGVVATAVSFLAPVVVEDTSLVFEVSLTNADGFTIKEQVTVIIRNTINEVPEVVLEFTSFEVKAGDLVQVGVAQVSDPNPKDTISINWAFSGAPVEIPLEDVSPPGASPGSIIQFVAPILDAEAILLLVVTVSDGQGSAQATAEIVVKPGEAACKPGEPGACDDGNVCTFDECDKGTCSNTPVTGTCDDGDACTQGDACAEGVCGPGEPVACADDDPCTTDACDPLTGCVFSAADGPCDDGNPCTDGDACTAAGCVGATSTLCVDGNPCTEDTCDPASGCVFAPTAGACDDGDSCTLDDSCADGACVGVPIANCDDGNGCTNDGCTADAGCIHTPIPGPCDDGSACTVNDRCIEGECVSGKALTCDDDNACTDDTCGALEGCLHSPLSGATCDDGDACTSLSRCDQGVCVGVITVECDDGEPCTADACSKETGCTFSPSGGDCSDGNACTTGDTCAEGACSPGTATVCNDNNPCTNDSCSPSSGCVFTASAEKPCDDGNACTTVDTCKSGTCQGAGAPNCDDGNACTQDSCVPASGCAHAALTGSACDDGSPCTLSDKCQAGACQPGGPNPACQCESDADCQELDDDNLCTGVLVCVGFQCLVKPNSVVVCGTAGNTACSANTCVPATGLCQQSPINNGGVCSDGNACTVADTCVAGACSPGAALQCNDGNVCTQDACNASSGCTFTPGSGQACSDGNACTTGDVCANGNCTGNLASCADGNPCTQDTCNPATGCVFQPTSGTCSDGNACTVGDSCAGGTCAPGSAVNCNDNNACTLDGCAPTTGCFYTNLINVACSDGNACTGGDTCGGGTCKGVAIECGDSNPCTQDSCNAATGCTFTPVPGACNDGNACTQQDACSAGTCAGATPVVCTDNNPCTADSCNPASGCVFAPQSGSCTDGNACTTNDTCAGGTCTAGPALVCNDGKVCTTDTCLPATGCAFVAAPGACSDGSACTVGDICSAGNCAPGSALVCNDNNPCTTDSCNPASGCVYAFNTASCNDGNPCTSGDKCAAGVCSGTDSCECESDTDCADDGNLCNGLPMCDLASNTCVTKPNSAVVCSTAPNGPCTANTCAPATGICSLQPLPNGTNCSDGNACTASDKCNASGVCNGTAVSCNDNNPCTNDSCAPASGCVFTPNTATCNDGNACTQGDVCSGGNCAGPQAVVCNDNNPCTADSCAPATGCTYTPQSGGCSDNNACTVGDSCSGGSCVPGGTANCNDGNPCTNDGCTPATGCTHTPNTATCSDGSACTTNDICASGTCQGGAPLTCNDNNPCTNDTCSAAAGCVYTPNSAPCTDNNACTVGDICAAGACKPGNTQSCNDNNPCTNDACAPASGCSNTPNSAPCDDGVACTSGDVCSGGVCLSGSYVCECETDDDCIFDGGGEGGGGEGGGGEGGGGEGGGGGGGGLCDGKLICDKSEFPYACKIDPETVVVCDQPADPCLESNCQGATGACVVGPAPFGKPCDDGNACTVGERCENGECSFGAPAGCQTSDGPGCFNCACEQCVCSADSFCCNTAWDGLCVERCIGECGQGCDGSAPVPETPLGCLQQAGPGCAGCACEDCVCAADPFCCNTQWDAACVARCDNECGADCSLAVPGCLESEFGGCANCGCASCVCEGNPLCCDVAWTEECVESCQWCTEQTCPAPPGSSAPGCVTTSGPGCAGCACESCVCAADPFCCESSWDNLCVNRCQTECGQSCTSPNGVDCNDGNPCTLDVCNPSVGCINTPFPNGAPCEDGNPCTFDETCQNGQCGGGTNSCNDNNPCTSDTCAFGDCVNTPNSLPCDDGNACTTGDICSNGQCVGGAPAPCNDGNPCTVDTCTAKGCVGAPGPMGAACGGDFQLCGFSGTCEPWDVDKWAPPSASPEWDHWLTGIHERAGSLVAVGFSAQGSDGNNGQGYVYGVKPFTTPNTLHQRARGLLAVFDDVAVGFGGAISRVQDNVWLPDLPLEKQLGTTADLYAVWRGPVGIATNPNRQYLFGTDGPLFQTSPILACIANPSGNPLNCGNGFSGGAGARVNAIVGQSVLGGTIAALWSTQSAFALSNPTGGSNGSTLAQIWRAFPGPGDWTSGSPTGCTPGGGSPCTGVTGWQDLFGNPGGQAFAVGDDGAFLYFDGQKWSPISIAPGIAAGTTPNQYALQGVVRKGADVFIAGTAVGCGSAGCATSAAHRAHVLLHYNLQTQSWLPMRILDAIQCSFDPKLCVPYFQRFGIGDIWWNDGNELAIVGATVDTTKEPARARMVAYALDLN